MELNFHRWITTHKTKIVSYGHICSHFQLSGEYYLYNSFVSEFILWHQVKIEGVRLKVDYCFLGGDSSHRESACCRSSDNVFADSLHIKALIILDEEFKRSGGFSLLGVGDWTKVNRNLLQQLDRLRIQVR
jgi:hypothetical protein